MPTESKLVRATKGVGELIVVPIVQLKVIASTFRYLSILLTMTILVSVAHPLWIGGATLVVWLLTWCLSDEAPWT